VNRKMGIGVHFDPMNVMTYPSAATESSERGVLFGLVILPKLECCGGQCGCPNGMCGCGKACDGCCAEHGGESMAHDGTSKEGRPSVAERSPAPVSGSCCSSKVPEVIAQ